jgi:hypothetical protein
MITFARSNIFDLLYSFLGVGAGAALTFCPEPHTNYAAPASDTTIGHENFFSPVLQKRIIFLGLLLLPSR